MKYYVIIVLLSNYVSNYAFCVPNEHGNNFKNRERYAPEEIKTIKKNGIHPKDIEENEIETLAKKFDNEKLNDVFVDLKGLPKIENRQGLVDILVLAKKKKYNVMRRVAMSLVSRIELETAMKIIRKSITIENKVTVDKHLIDVYHSLIENLPKMTPDGKIKYFKFQYFMLESFKSPNKKVQEEAIGNAREVAKSATLDDLEKILEIEMSNSNLSHKIAEDILTFEFDEKLKAIEGKNSNGCKKSIEEYRTYINEINKNIRKIRLDHFKKHGKGI